MVANGAEPVSVQALRRFIERFGPYGFRPGAMAPVYGLAENSVGLAFPPPGRPPLIDRVEREALSRRGIAEPARADDPHPLEISGCGVPLPGHEIRIVDEAGREVGERCEGRLEFRGPSATSGYFHNERKTLALFHGGWLDSGDLAYMAGGDVFITGRIKDIIIRAGRNILSPGDRRGNRGNPRMRKGCVAVFGVTDRASGTERVVIMAETRETDTSARAALLSRAHEIASDIAGTAPDEIILAPPRSVPKTSSGKIRRSAAKELYETRASRSAAASAWRQILRLSLAGIWTAITRFTSVVGQTLYASWWWIVVSLAYMAAWFAVMLLPRLNWRWRAVRGLARAVLAAIGARFQSRAFPGFPRVTPSPCSIIRAIWTSWCSLPFCPENRLTWPSASSPPNPFIGPFMRRLGTLFVERSTLAQALPIPRMPSLRPGKDAHSCSSPRAHSRAGPGCRNSISALSRWRRKRPAPCTRRDPWNADHAPRRQWFPRRTSVRVTIENPIMPSGKDFASVLRLAR